MTSTDAAASDTTTPQRPPTLRALIVVDAQNDFVSPDGALSVPGAVARLEQLNELIAAAADAGWLIVYTADWHPERTPHFVTDGGPWPPHCVAGTWGAQFHDDLLVVDGAEVVHKGTGGEDGYSGFTMVDDNGVERSTGLHDIIASVDARTAMVAGFATDYCVSATALDAARVGLDTVFVIDAAAAVNLEPGDGDRAIAAMIDAGVNVSSTAAALREIRASAPVAA